MIPENLISFCWGIIRIFTRTQDGTALDWKAGGNDEHARKALVGKIFPFPLLQNYLTDRELY